MEISFLPGRISSLTLSVLMSSVLTNYVSVHASAVTSCYNMHMYVHLRTMHEISLMHMYIFQYNCCCFFKITYSSDSNNMATSQPNGDSPDFYFQTEATTLTSHSTSGHTVRAYMYMLTKSCTTTVAHASIKCIRVHAYSYMHVDCSLSWSGTAAEFGRCRPVSTCHLHDSPGVGHTG